MLAVRGCGVTNALSHESSLDKRMTTSSAMGGVKRDVNE